MKNRTSLLSGAALGALFAFAAVTGADAKPKHPDVDAPAAAPSSGGSAVQGEIDALKAEMQSLSAREQQDAATAQAAQAQVQQLQGQLTDANARADRAEAQVAEQIQTIPGDVTAAVAKIAPKTDKLYYKGVTITLGGFAAAEGVYRSKNDVADIGSNYSKIPYLNNENAHEDELRGTGRQSRLSILAQGNINPDLTAAFYGEFDFMAGPQTGNSNESNSFSPRIRNLYATLDWSSEGWHLLAGQNWSLATMNTKGITPRNELPPPTIEAQYVPGFVWARQPQLRIVKDFDKQLWIGISFENPQTTVGSPATGVVGTQSNGAVTGLTVTTSASGIAEFDSANSLSLNHAPDVIGKIAWEPMLGGKQPLHLEVFGLWRNFYDKVYVATSNAQTTALGFGAVNTEQSSNSYGAGVGGGFVWSVIPGVVDLEGSALAGNGIGRYGAGQLPDTVVQPNGSLTPIPEIMAMAGATWHATPKLDLYAFGGGEFEKAVPYDQIIGGTTVHAGLGNANASLGGCFVELVGTCSPDTKQEIQYTVGFWDKIWTGSYGQVRFGLQYSHTELRAFPGLEGTGNGILSGSPPASTVVQPITTEDMFFTSFRYYPF
ncbi:MAG TPA: hypothetical protein VGL58_15800 [Caulobacteraceae bacterium]|jgi:hypothetical protein